MKKPLPIYLFVSIFILACALSLSASRAEESPPLTVVELYTSQGCSSCPPADIVLKNLTREKDVLALSFAVDYWNYLGWKDIFSQPQFTRRQQDYNRALGREGVFTPQMIINGQKSVVGSRSGQVRRLVKAAQTKGPDINFQKIADKMLSLRVGEGAGDATIWLVGYDTAKEVKIGRGELRGRTQAYHNVVRSLKHIGNWMGEEIKLTFASDEMSGVKCDNYAILIQQDTTGPILAAARLEGVATP